MLGSVPSDATTLDIYKSMLPLRVLSIDILEDARGGRSGSVRVRLTPPQHDYWYDRTWQILIHGPPPRPVRVPAFVDKSYRKQHDSIVRTPLNKIVASLMPFDLPMLGQGFMHQKRTMMVMDDVEDHAGAKIRFEVDFGHRRFAIYVSRSLEGPSPLAEKSKNAGAGSPPPWRLPVDYRIDIQFSWLKHVWEQRFPGGRTCVVLTLDSPPGYWRKVRDASVTHGNDRRRWTSMEQWVRMAYLTVNQRAARDAAVSLNGVFPQGRAVDMGRWTVFRLGFNQKDACRWQDAVPFLKDFNVHVKLCPEFRFMRRDDRSMWDCIRADSTLQLNDSISSNSNVHHLSRRLSFEVAYQLEVCISRNILRESTLDVVFLESLAALAPELATRVLEYVAERGKRIYQPHAIFRDPKAASYWRKTPSGESLDNDSAVFVRKAIVTPTTIIFSTPALEGGNRVLRHFRDHHDRFLRVQFTDELLIGRLSGGLDSTRTDECFLRAFRALKNGIDVGGRHFEFLAFGNSQLRENSTYFFAPTNLLSCQDIRDWMGDFRSIKSIAKYAARLGQCLSTTLPVPTFGVPTTVQRIPDVENGRFCFTDGVGKISKWWARIIAGHVGADEVPSAVQFRMGGCKGILVVWPDVPPGQVVQIRPSQEKFPTPGSGHILEIVRCSETSTASLNQQIILLLLSLGVPGSVFLDLLHEELSGLDAVMTDPDQAEAQLMARVDQNRTTPMVADMVKAGFMESDEPFVWALLQLWRSWILKTLKEKARINVEKSAFVLGCVDETGTLRGHVNVEPKTSASEQQLPQIFLQVPDLETGIGGFTLLSRGRKQPAQTFSKYKVITGLCLVGRNPSLHPGDLRVVEAVDVPALHHLRDVVVFPCTGDRDIPSMCSGGDLDGDDYFVFWDERLLPPRKAWNYEAMSYDTVREPEVAEVTPRHLIAFFVLHMKHDTLPRIAMAHRAYADQLQGHAMNPRCLELAQLHSQAVDFAKTGVPALMPLRLSPRDWPHWMNRAHKKMYRSATALGLIYDEVQVENFEPAYDKPFDKRILGNYAVLDAALLRRARQLKSQYDLALRRAMAQRDIESEFEMWTGFVMTRPRVGSDYKLAEDTGRLFRAIVTRFRRLCLKEADNSHDITNLGPIVAAMYRVTHEEVRIALHEVACHAQRHLRKDIGDLEDEAANIHRPGKLTHHTAPFISFPWLFAHELGSLAKGSEAMQDGVERSEPEARPKGGPILTAKELKEMGYCVKQGVATHHGVPLDVSAYDGSRDEKGTDAGDREGDGDGDGDRDFQPMWTLPAGKSEGDVVIELVAEEEGSAANQEEGNRDDDEDYDLLGIRETGTGSINSGNGVVGKAAVQSDVLSWAELEDDAMSTTSEESLAGKVQTIAIKRDDDEEEADGDEKDKPEPAQIRGNGQGTDAAEAAEAAVGLAVNEADEAGEAGEDEDGDLFVMVDHLFGGADGQQAKKGV